MNDLSTSASYLLTIATTSCRRNCATFPLFGVEVAGAIAGLGAERVEEPVVSDLPVALRRSSGWLLLPPLPQQAELTKVVEAPLDGAFADAEVLGESGMRVGNGRRLQIICFREQDHQHGFAGEAQSIRIPTEPIGPRNAEVADSVAAGGLAGMDPRLARAVLAQQRGWAVFASDEAVILEARTILHRAGHLVLVNAFVGHASCVKRIDLLVEALLLGADAYIAQ